MCTKTASLRNRYGEQTEINQVPEQKDLGVIIDDKLKFVPHIQAMVKKADINLGIIKRTFRYLDKTIFLNLYKSIVRPNLEYASTVWSVIYKKRQHFHRKRAENSNTTGT